MPISVVCPGCSVKLSAPDAAAGKNVKCPKCQAAIEVPLQVIVEEEFEVIEEPQPVKKPAPPPPARRPAAWAVVEGVADEDDEDDRPRRKRRQDEDDDEVDDDDDRPRKKNKKQAPPKSMLVRNVVGGVLLLVALGVAGWVYYDRFQKEEEAKSGDSPKASGPTAIMPTNPLPPPMAGGNPPPPDPGKKNNPGGNTGQGTGPRLPASRVGGPVLSPDGTLLLARASLPGGVAVGVWETRSGNFVTSIGAGMNGDRYGVSPDGTQAAVISLGKQTLTFWELPSGQLAKTVKLPAIKEGIDLPPFVTYTPDGKAVVTAYEKQLLRIDPASGEVKVLLDDVKTRDTAYCPARNVAADLNYSNADNQVVLRVFDLARGGPPKVIPRPKAGEFESFSLALSANGSVVAVGVSGDREKKAAPAVHLYDTATGQQRASIPFGNADGVSAIQDVSLSPDGGRVFATGHVTAGGKPTFVLKVTDPAGTAFQQVAEDDRDLIQITDATGDGKTIAYTTDKGPRFYNTDTGTSSELKP